jgi:Domain of unknown function (DUF4184)
MPFTPTHVLAILPIAAIKRLSLPFSALVIGSMIPDFPLFVPLSPDYSTTHSVPGLLTACLPLGLACFLVFQVFMKRSLFALLPAAIQSRCLSHATRCVEPSLKLFACASLAVVVGACTHLFWDSFTHRGRWGTQLFPLLDETALTIGGHAFAGFKVLQYGSTLFGLPCIVLLLATWLYRQTPVSLGSHAVLSGSTKAVAYLIVLAVPIAAVCLVWRREELSPYDRLGQSITMSGLALSVVTLTYCLAFPTVERRLSQPK